MEASNSAAAALAVIRDPDRLGHLRRRPRCSDGSLDMRSKANKNLSKYARVTDYYDPADPAVDVNQALIDDMLKEQQKIYDEARFKDLTTRIRELEEERSELRRFKARALRLLRHQFSLLEKLWSIQPSQPQD